MASNSDADAEAQSVSCTRSRRPSRLSQPLEHTYRRTTSAEVHAAIGYASPQPLGHELALGEEHPAPGRPSRSGAAPRPELPMWTPVQVGD
jgi:hypothetical protein